MAKAPAANTARTPVEARGAALLSLIAAAGDNGLMLTQAEGMDAVTAGHAIVDTSKVEGDTAKVTLTDAGRAALTGTAGGAANGSKYEVETSVAMPEAAKTRRGRQSSYPFDLLAAPVDGQFSSFHVSGDPEKTAAKLLSSAASARSRYVTEGTETRTVKVRNYERGKDGKFTKDAEGKRILLSETETDKPVRVVNRDFKVLPVDASDPKGAGARVWRVK